MIFTAISFVLAILVAVFVFLFRALAARPVQNFSAEWLNTFSLESYAPMERLLDHRDLEFLQSQPGYRPDIGKHLMEERRRIFGDYLLLLIRDFNQLIAVGKIMLVYSQQDRPDLARTLWRQQLAFYFAVSAIRCKLALYPFGWPAVDVHRLTEALAAMRDQVQLLAPQASAAAQ